MEEETGLQGQARREAGLAGGEPIDVGLRGALDGWEILGNEGLFEKRDRLFTCKYSPLANRTLLEYKTALYYY